MKLAFVSGAAGFCGVHLCHYLTRKGYRVSGSYHSHKPQATNGASFYPADITKRSDVESVIKKVKPHYIYHLAAMSVPRLSWNREQETFDSNVTGTIHLSLANCKFISLLSDRCHRG